MTKKLSGVPLFHRKNVLRSLAVDHFPLINILNVEYTVLISKFLRGPILQNEKHIYIFYGDVMVNFHRNKYCRRLDWAMVVVVSQFLKVHLVYREQRVNHHLIFCILR